MIMHVLEVAKPVKAERGFYLIYTDQSGAEIYLQGNFDQELIGFNPHFAGKSRFKVGLTRMIERDSSELDGGFHAWANPKDENVEVSGEYPFVFDVPDFRSVEIAAYPQTREIQLTAFASHDFKVFAGEEDYQQAQESELDYASKMFVPVGLFAFDDANDSVDLSAVRPVGMFAGEIKEIELKTNALSGEKFYWLLVETYGGEVDVVVDPKYVPAEPQIGGIVSGTFWLSGKVLG
jgi:hypothetical protein